MRQTREFLALVMVQDDVALVNALLDSMAVDSVATHDGLITATLALRVPTATAAPPAAEPGLTEAELARLETRLDAVDTFVTYVIKHLTTAPAAENMEPLFDVLLELRYELIAILSAPQRSDTDPVRALFVSAWDRLTPILHGIAERQADHAGALRYLTFIAAGDMLRALDTLGPGAGIDISSDGLRRLARILIPDDPRDPLQRDDGIDPELRGSMGFGEPLPPPQNTNETSWLHRLFRPAHAAEQLDLSTVRKLNNWVPKTTDMDVYLPMVRDVLRHVVTQQLSANELDRAFHEVFRNLVFTTAWQESCWRQFVAEENKRVPLQSGTGDIGMMQINPRVWRGFYDQHGLKWDIVYNARAGADILQHHMINYAIGNREHSITGKVENLARSTYAAYNGGPRQHDRYRRRDATARAKEVDTLFYKKYRTVSSGEDLAVKACFAN